MFEKIITYVKAGIAFGKQVAMGNDGMGSASRVIALVVVTTCMGVLITHVAICRSLPSADQMYGLSALIAAGSGAYATNKIRRDSRGADDQPPPLPPQGGPQ